MPVLPRSAEALNVRSMTERDLRQVLHIERRSFTIPWSAATFRGLLRRQSASLIVGEWREMILAYAVLWYAADEAELGDMAVLPEARGSGLGAWMLEKALGEARSRGAKRVFLEVRESNDVARRLYERAGFDTTGRRANYYSEPVEDAILMTRSLSSKEAGPAR